MSSNLIVCRDTAAQASKRLRKKLLANHGCEISLSDAQHLFAQTLGAANWQSLSFEEGVETEVKRQLTYFRMNIAYKRKNANKDVTHCSQTIDISEALLRAHYNAYTRDMFHNGITQSLMIPDGSIEDPNSIVSPIEFVDVDLMFEYQTLKKSTDYTALDVACLRTLLRMARPTLWQDASYDVYFSDGKQDTARYGISLVTGEIDGIKTMDDLHKDKTLERESLTWADMDFDIVRAPVPGVKFARIDKRLELLEYMILKDDQLAQFYREVAEALVFMLVKDDNRKDATESIDVLFDELDGDHIATGVFVNLLAGKIELILSKLKISKGVERVKEALTVGVVEDAMIF